MLEEGLKKGKKLYEIFPKYEDYSKLNLPEKLELAKAAGIDLGSWLPQGKIAKGLVEGEAGLGGLGLMGHIPAALKGLASWHLLPAMFLQSPRIVGKLAYGAGKARKYAPDIIKGLENIPNLRAIGALQQINPTKED